MRLKLALQILIDLFAVSEIALVVFRRAKLSWSVRKDHGSIWVLWCVIIAALLAENVLSQHYSLIDLPVSATTRRIIAMALVLIGLALRWAAVVSLGRQFTVNVAIAKDHYLLQTGLYRYVRHPSYTGLLLALLGIAIKQGSWGGIVIIMVPVLAAMFYRIHYEELALRKTFGAEYSAYASHTRRLIPGVM